LSKKLEVLNVSLFTQVCILYTLKKFLFRITEFPFRVSTCSAYY